MDDTLAVRVSEREGNLLHQARDPRRVERRFFLCEVEEIASRQVLDDEVEEPVQVFAPVEDGDDPVVTESGWRLEPRGESARSASGWVV